MNIIIETERLYLREFNENDAPLLFELNSDKEVIRFTNDPFRDVAHAREVLTPVILPQYQQYKHGRWVVHLKINNEFIGWCGLKYLEEEKRVHVGYPFMKKYWRIGYATEAAKACIEYGFHKLALKQIIAKAAAKNTASIRVLEKCKMQLAGLAKEHEMDIKVFTINNPLISDITH